jgi:hypothetical protein
MQSTAASQGHARLGLDSFAIGRAYSNRAAPRPWLFVARNRIARATIISTVFLSEPAMSPNG